MWAPLFLCFIAALIACKHAPTVAHGNVYRLHHRRSALARDRLEAKSYVPYTHLRKARLPSPTASRRMLRTVGNFPTSTVRLTMKMRLGWWNTGLNHRGRGSTEVACTARKEATRIIQHLLLRYELDALALCEVRSDHLSEFVAAVGPGFSVYIFDSCWGKRKAGDLGLIIRDGTTRVVGHEYESHQIEKRTLAIGVSVAMTFHSVAFTWVISHWPSRRYLPRGAPERHIFGAALRAVVKQWKARDPLRHIVLAGDYNDEPFDDSLAAQLLATRDTSRLLNSELTTYNPFWRKLGTHEAFLNTKPGQQAAGTYRYASGRETTWHTFDQMIFCREFIVGRTLHLVEEETGIIADDDIFELVRNARHGFDHLPILGVMETTS